MASQEARKAETRSRLLAAAAELFAERGIDAVSVDTIAEAADRTSGSVYAHFGGKDGLLTALLDDVVNETAAVMGAELTPRAGEATTVDEDARLASLWRAFADPASAAGQGWMLLEHELWLYACRHDAARAHFASRFAEARRMVRQSASAWSGPPGAPDADEVAPLLVALLVGLEMQHRVDPTAITDAVAVAGLRAVTGIGTTDTTNRPPIPLEA